MQNIFRILFWMALIFALTMAILPQPPKIIESSDKFQHMLAFATLALLAVLGYPALSKWKIGAGLLALGLGIEIVQMIPSLNRDADLGDLIADGIAIGAMLAAVAILCRRRDKPGGV